ncbi:MAG: hypothetical protein JXR52_09000 [Bacteroidales bacterium]|nr:hypothetical protein [Bacteroidales bacterium]MBN2698951.1 hypothetical protein [Bacteroidales bacterium]
MLRTAVWILLCLPAISSRGQLTDQGYRLLPGKRYSLEISVRQNTHSENYYSRSDLRLDLNMTLHFDIVSASDSGGYHVEASYDNLFLSMLAPDMSIDINSGKDNLLNILIDSLEQKPFRMYLNRDGSFILMDSISAFLNTFYHLELSGEELDVIIKTLKEAFGTDAFNSLCNLFINIHPTAESGTGWEKQFTYFFNTRPVKMINRFFPVKQTNQLRILQGIGMIITEKEIIGSSEQSTVSTTASGSQTYDLQIDPVTGWLKSGNSRQRILVKTKILEDSRLPSGLEIPSYVETLFTLTGQTEH